MTLQCSRVKLQEHHEISKSVMVYAQLMRNTDYSQANLKKTLKEKEKVLHGLVFFTPLHV